MTDTRQSVTSGRRKREAAEQQRKQARIETPGLYYPAGMDFCHDNAEKRKARFYVEHWEDKRNYLLWGSVAQAKATLPTALQTPSWSRNLRKNDEL